VASKEAQIDAQADADDKRDEVDDPYEEEGDKLEIEEELAFDFGDGLVVDRMNMMRGFEDDDYPIRSGKTAKEKMTSPSAKEESETTFVAYPRSCSFAWSNRGHLVTFSYHKYDFTKLENKPQTTKKNQTKFPKEIPGKDFDWKFYF